MTHESTEQSIERNLRELIGSDPKYQKGGSERRKLERQCAEIGLDNDYLPEDTGMHMSDLETNE